MTIDDIDNPYKSTEHLIEVNAFELDATIGMGLLPQVLYSLQAIMDNYTPIVDDLQHLLISTGIGLSLGLCYDTINYIKDNT